jgi:hypothetical protein
MSKSFVQMPESTNALGLSLADIPGHSLIFTASDQGYRATGRKL